MIKTKWDSLPGINATFEQPKKHLISLVEDMDDSATVICDFIAAEESSSVDAFAADRCHIFVAATASTGKQAKRKPSFKETLEIKILINSLVMSLEFLKDIKTKIKLRSFE